MDGAAYRVIGLRCAVLDFLPGSATLLRGLASLVLCHLVCHLCFLRGICLGVASSALCLLSLLIGAADNLLKTPVQILSGSLKTGMAIRVALNKHHLLTVRQLAMHNVSLSCAMGIWLVTVQPGRLNVAMRG